MVESKQVKVDNWGIFFLQRLQQFYNKSSYCDLILQFEDNVRVKVHRLVMNACTEYFQILEQTCQVENGCLIMPSNLPSEVVIPIINFMYSGILEFQETSFDRFYSTAKLMNMSVLTKLLDAQKTPIKPPVTRRIQSVTPITWNLQGRKIFTKPYMEPDLPETLPGRKLPIWKRKSVPTNIPYYQSSNNYEPFTKIMRTPVDEPPKPTRFEWPDEDASFENTFDDISYESKPLILPTFTPEKSPKPSTSTFEDIRKTAGPIKRSASPIGNQCKKVNIQDVKDYLKEHKIRSDYIDYDDSEITDNDLQTYDDDSNEEQSKEATEVSTSNLDETPSKSILKNESATCQQIKHVRFSLEGKENDEKKTPISKTIPIKTPQKDTNTPDMSKHTKIITEVLKKYPHLVKNNKNIRLKILAKGNGNVLKTTPVKGNTVAKPNKISYMVMKPDQNQATQSSGAEKEQTWECTQCEEHQTFTAYHTYRQHLTEAHNEKEDSQLCTICGYTSRKLPMLVHHKFIRHKIPPPAMYNFPKCPDCPYIAFSPVILQKHMASSHQYTCYECKENFPMKDALLTHLQQTGHAIDKSLPQYECKLCDKKFFSENILNTHIKKYHVEPENTSKIIEPVNIVKTKDKIKIISDVKVNPSLPNQNLQVKTIETPEIKSETVITEQSSEAEALSNVASGIAASLGLVDTIVVLDDNQFILQSQHGDIQQNILNANGNNYILPPMSEIATSRITQINQNPAVTLSDTNAVLTQTYKTGINSTDELVMVLTDHDYSDGTSNAVMTDNNIVVLYSHPVQTQAGTMMLTSETGMIEVDKNYVQNIPVSLATQTVTTSHCEESIEMIQQEINNQNDTIQTENDAQIQNNIQEIQQDNEEVMTMETDEDITKDSNKETQEMENSFIPVDNSSNEIIIKETEVDATQNIVDVKTNLEIVENQLCSMHEYPHDTIRETVEIPPTQEDEEKMLNVPQSIDVNPEENIESQIHEDIPIEESLEEPQEELIKSTEEDNSSVVKIEKPNEIENYTIGPQNEEENITTKISQETEQEIDLEKDGDLPEAAIEKEADQVLKEDESTDLNNYEYIVDKNYEENVIIEEKAEIKTDITQSDSIPTSQDILSSSEEYLTPGETITDTQESIPTENLPTIQESSTPEDTSQDIIPTFTSTQESLLLQPTQDIPIPISCNSQELIMPMETEEIRMEPMEDNTTTSIPLETTTQEVSESIENATEHQIGTSQEEPMESSESNIPDEASQNETCIPESNPEQKEIDTSINESMEIDVPNIPTENISLQQNIDENISESLEKNIQENKEKEVENTVDTSSKNVNNEDDQNLTGASNDKNAIKDKVLRNDKISNILDDWDDGDSDSPQSFSKAQPQENENSSINKLIDDWNDEEDT